MIAGQHSTISLHSRPPAARTALRSLPRALVSSQRPAARVSIMASASLTIGYWNIKGLAAPLRAMSMYVGKEFHNVSYPLLDKEGGGLDGSSWFSAKPALKEKNPLMNLPYLIDVLDGQEVVIAQSNACMLHLGRTLGLWGKSEREIIRCEELLCEIMDLRNMMTRHAYSPSGADKGAGASLIGAATGKNGTLAKLELCLTAEPHFSTATPFFVGGHATAPDFHAWEMIDQYCALASFLSLPPLLAAFPKLQEFHTAFAALPANARYMGSVLHTKLPFNNKSAGFGSTLSGEPYMAAPDSSIVDSNGVF